MQKFLKPPKLAYYKNRSLQAVPSEPSRQTICPPCQQYAFPHFAGRYMPVAGSSNSLIEIWAYETQLQIRSYAFSEQWDVTIGIAKAVDV